MIIRIVVLIALFLFGIVAYLKYFEKKGIFYPSKEIEATPAAGGLTYEDIYFTTDDGFKLNGWFIPAENPQGTILFCHGNAGNISHRVGIIILFHNIGLNTFIFDYRGYGRSQGRPYEEGLYRDAQAAYKYLVDKKGIDEDRVIIYGKSLGVSVAVDLASGVNAGFLIADSGISSGYDMAKVLFPYLPVKGIISVKFDNVAKIKNISIPKLIIHSKDDEVVPFKLGRKLFEAASFPKEFYQMQGGHNEGIFMAGKEYQERINDFLNKYLPQKEASL